MQPKAKKDNLLSLFVQNGGNPKYAPKDVNPDPQTHQAWYMPKIGREMQ